jgi:uncharacterized protein YggE
MMTTVAALAALALAVAALGMLLARPQTTAAAESGGLVRQITVVGSGDVKVVPDTVQVQVGVQTQAPSAQAALNDNNAQMAALLNKLREAGIAPTDIQTSNVSVWPRYTGDGRTVEGYEANNSVTVKIHDITRTGELLDQVVAAGANTISGVSFTVDDPKALQQNARNAALTDARARAEAMAQSIGGSLGQVLSITENIGTPPPQPYRMEMAQTGAGTSSVPIQPGEQTITAQVQVTYELR